MRTEESGQEFENLFIVIDNEKMGHFRNSCNARVPGTSKRTSNDVLSDTEFHAMPIRASNCDLASMMTSMFAMDQDRSPSITGINVRPTSVS